MALATNPPRTNESDRRSFALITVGSVPPGLGALDDTLRGWTGSAQDTLRDWTGSAQDTPRGWTGGAQDTPYAAGQAAHRARNARRDRPLPRHAIRDGTYDAQGTPHATGQAAHRTRHAAGQAAHRTRNARRVGSPQDTQYAWDRRRTGRATCDWTGGAQDTQRAADRRRTGHATRSGAGSPLCTPRAVEQPAHRTRNVWRDARRARAVLWMTHCARAD